VGILFFIPGVLSDLVAVLLWLPSLRQKVLRGRKSSINRPSAANDDSVQEDLTQYTRTSSTVIEGEWVEKSPMHPQNDRLS
jgi:UPF0716 family protein affecting phage T7 exclusion